MSKQAKPCPICHGPGLKPEDEGMWCPACWRSWRRLTDDEACVPAPSVIAEWSARRAWAAAGKLKRKPDKRRDAMMILERISGPRAALQVIAVDRARRMAGKEKGR